MSYQLLIAAVMTSIGSPAVAPDGAGVDARTSHFAAWASSATEGPVRGPVRAATPVAPAASSSSRLTPAPAVRIEFRTPCEVISERTSGCVSSAGGCPEGQTEYRQWRVSDDAEIPLGLTCSSPETAVVAAAAPPQVTEAMVLEAFRQVPVPALRSVSEPEDKTLVNFETILHTEAEPLTRTVSILGQRVRLEIVPSAFRWEHGDGTSATTSTPGAPYPRKDVVHLYQKAGVTVNHRVVVTWSAQWSLNGGPLQPVAGTVTTTGPTTALRVAEAIPALSGERG